MCTRVAALLARSPPRPLRFCDYFSPSSSACHALPAPRPCLTVCRAHRLLGRSLDELARTGAERGEGCGGRGQKRVRRSGSWWTVDGTGEVHATIAQQIDALKAASAAGGLAPAALEECVLCLIKTARLGVGADHTAGLMWSLRPREAIWQSTMTKLLSAINNSTFPTLLRTQVLRWLLLMLEAEAVGTLGREARADGSGGSEGAQNSRAPALHSEGAILVSLSHMFILLLRPLYRVIFHMLIAACSSSSSSSVAVPAASSSAVGSEAHSTVDRYELV